MKRAFYVVLFLAVSLGCSACAGKKDIGQVLSQKPAETSKALDFAGENSAEAKETSKPKEKKLSKKDSERKNSITSYGFPFRLWGPEGMELYCFYIYEDHALRHWSSDCEHSEIDNLSWKVSNNQLDITGDWNESFTIDLEAETATSMSTGKVYRIVVD